MKYGLIEVKGHINGSIDGIKLEAEGSIDYSKMPCVKKIERAQITEFRTIKLDITGLYPLNSMTSSILEWIGRSYKNDIVKLIEDKLMEVGQQELTKVECERYRPDRLNEE